MMAGKQTRGLRVRVLNKPIGASAPKPPLPPLKLAPAATTPAEPPPWLDQPDDPGASDFTDFGDEAHAD